MRGWRGVASQSDKAKVIGVKSGPNVNNRDQEVSVYMYVLRFNYQYVTIC